MANYTLNKGGADTTPLENIYIKLLYVSGGLLLM